MASKSKIVDSFASIGVPEAELRLLAFDIDWDSKELPEDVAIILRDCWKRCKRGEARPEAFWPWIDSQVKMDDFLF